jgi:hypothetical protein
LKQPQHHSNHDDDIDNIFNLSVHRNIVVHKPEDYPDYDKYNDKIDKRHIAPFVFPITLKLILPCPNFQARLSLAAEPPGLPVNSVAGLSAFLHGVCGVLGCFAPALDVSPHPMDRVAARGQQRSDC